MNVSKLLTGLLEVAFGVSGTDIQVAAAIPGNLVATANASFKNRDFTTSVWQDDGTDEIVIFEGTEKHRIWEMGLGYYHIWDGGVTIEGIVGYGQGNLDNVETDIFGPIDPNNQASANTFITSSNFNKVYIQPTLGISRKVFDFGFTPKVAMVRVSIDDQQFRNTFFEPTATLRFGHEYVKFTGQAGLSLPFNQEVEYSFEPFIFSVGVMADINILKFRKKGG